MSELLPAALATVLWPAMAAGLLALVGSLLPPGHGRNACFALGLAAGWLLGQWLAVRPPRWPPVAGVDWQYGCFAAAIAPVLLPAWWNRSPARTAAWMLPASALSFLLIFLGLVRNTWTLPSAALWISGAAVWVSLTALSLPAVGRSLQAGWTLGLLLLFCAGTAALLVLGGAASFGHSAGVLAAAVGGMWVVALVLRRQVDLGAVGWLASLLWGGLVFQGHLFASLALVPLVLLGLAWPLAAVVAGLVRSLPGKARVGLVFSVLALTTGAALGLALWREWEKAAGGRGYY